MDCTLNIRRKNVRGSGPSEKCECLLIAVEDKDGVFVGGNHLFLHGSIGELGEFAEKIVASIPASVPEVPEVPKVPRELTIEERALVEKIDAANGFGEVNVPEEFLPITSTERALVECRTEIILERECARCGVAESKHSMPDACEKFGTLADDSFGARALKTEMFIAEESAKAGERF